MSAHLIILTVINAVLLGINFADLPYIKARALPEFDTGVARLAVREHLDKLSLKGQTAVRLDKGCVEPQGNNGIVTGSGEASNQSRVIHGIPVTEAARFAYRADVSANCSAYSLPCYEVQKLTISGSHSLLPRL